LNLFTGTKRVIEEWTDIYGIIRSKNFKSFIRFKRYIDEEEQTGEDLERVLKVLNFKQVDFKMPDYTFRLLIVWFMKRSGIHKFYSKYVLMNLFDYLI
jgi:hypothetical protein